MEKWEIMRERRAETGGTAEAPRDVGEKQKLSVQLLSSPLPEGESAATLEKGARKQI